MSQEKKFIKTTDEKTADKLIVLGFQLIAHVGNVYTFLNQPSLNFNFEESERKKVAYTNTLNI